MAAIAPAATLAALSLTAAACGGTETDPGGSPPAATSSSAVADAVAETRASGAAQFTLTLEHTRDEATFGIEAGEQESLEGSVDFEHGRTALGSEGGDNVIVEAAALYFQPAAEGDTRWRKFEFATAPFDTTYPDISLGRFDVDRQLGYVESIADSLRLAGEEQVDGDTLTRYTGYGVAEELMQALVAGPLYALLQWESHARVVERSDEFPIDVWVADDGRVHKVVYDFPDFSSFVGELTTIELHDFGADLEIELPSDAEVVD